MSSLSRNTGIPININDQALLGTGRIALTGNEAYNFQNAFRILNNPLAYSTTVVSTTRELFDAVYPVAISSNIGYETDLDRTVRLARQNAEQTAAIARTRNFDQVAVLADARSEVASYEAILRYRLRISPTEAISGDRALQVGRANAELDYAVDILVPNQNVRTGVLNRAIRNRSIVRGVNEDSLEAAREICNLAII